jgi:hypothetical protein
VFSRTHGETRTGEESVDAIEKNPVSYLEKQIKTLQEWRLTSKVPFSWG